MVSGILLEGETSLVYYSGVEVEAAAAASAAAAAAAGVAAAASTTELSHDVPLVVQHATCIEFESVSIPRVLDDLERKKALGVAGSRRPPAPTEPTVYVYLVYVYNDSTPPAWGLGGSALRPGVCHLTRHQRQSLSRYSLYNCWHT